MLRALRFLGLLIVQTVIAIVGTMIAEHAIWRVIPAHSVFGVLWKECTLSVVFATLIGFGMWRTWQSAAAKWAWVPAAVWFAIGFIIPRGDVWGGLFPSGSVFTAPDARSFFAFTIPLLRATFYSIGAYISSLLYSGAVARTPIR